MNEAITVQNGNGSALASQSYFVTQPMKALELANTVAGLVKEKNLARNISGNQYVIVEGWQFAGLNLGLLPIVHEPERMNTNIEGEIKYKCRVDLVDPNGIVRGHGFAICSNQEKTKKSFDEYAIYSMAQTRAEGKAYRNTIAWLMKAAGFETTPYEEMDEVENNQAKSKPKQTKTLSPAEIKQGLETAEKELKKAGSREDVLKIWNSFPELKKNKQFQELVKPYSEKFPEMGNGVMPGDVIDLKKLDDVKKQLKGCKSEESLDELYEVITSDEGYSKLNEKQQQELFEYYEGCKFDFHNKADESEGETDGQ